MLLCSVVIIVVIIIIIISFLSLSVSSVYHYVCLYVNARILPSNRRDFSRCFSILFFNFPALMLLFFYLLHVRSANSKHINYFVIVYLQHAVVVCYLLPSLSCAINFVFVQMLNLLLSILFLYFSIYPSLSKPLFPSLSTSLSFSTFSLHFMRITLIVSIPTSATKTTTTTIAKQIKSVYRHEKHVFWSKHFYSISTGYY